MRTTLPGPRAALGAAVRPFAELSLQSEQQLILARRVESRVRVELCRDCADAERSQDWAGAGPCVLTQDHACHTHLIPSCPHGHNCLAMEELHLLALLSMWTKGPSVL